MKFIVVAIFSVSFFHPLFFPTRVDGNGQSKSGSHDRPCPDGCHIVQCFEVGMSRTEMASEDDSKQWPRRGNMCIV